MSGRFDLSVTTISLYLFVLGGIGGCTVGMHSNNSSLLTISVISFLPMVNIWAWQWLDDKRYKYISKVTLKVLVVVLLAVISLVAISDPRVGLVLLFVVPLLGFMFGPLVVIWFQEVLGTSSWIKKIGIAVGPPALVAFFLLVTKSPGVLKIFFLVSMGAVLLYVYLSAFGLGYAIWKGQDLDERPMFNLGMFNSYFFYIGTFIALVLLLIAGFERALFFLPSEWGGYGEDGEWVSYRQYFSFLIAMGLTGFITYLIGKYHEERIRRVQVSKKRVEK